jgi:1-acyl-sn-glycerol-3-phosphate acyltransferase
MPLGRAWRPFVSWYGDMEMLPHGWHLIGLGRLTATVLFHTPVSFAAFGSRKALAEHCERVVARGLAAANCGRSIPAASQPPVPERAPAPASP